MPEIVQPVELVNESMVKVAPSGNVAEYDEILAVVAPFVVVKLLIFTAPHPGVSTR